MKTDSQTEELTPMAASAPAGQRRHLVLIADDYEADRFFLREAIRKHAPSLDVIAEAEDGEEVIAYLWGFGEYADREKYPLPTLLIMDVRMPRMTGIQVLEWLETQNLPELKVAMLADSSAVQFRVRAEELGLKHFYPKTGDARELVDIVKQLQAELESGGQGRFL